MLVHFHADINYAPDNIRSALSQHPGACLRSDTDMVKFLLDNEANPNLLCQERVSPLSAATSTKGNVQLVKLLLEHGADIHNAGEYTFHVAVSGGKEMLTYLFAQPMTATQRERYLNAALQNALLGAVMDLVVWLLDQGADPSYRGGGYGCPFTAAVSNMHVCEASDMNNRHLILNLLLQRGADPSPQPLHASAHLEMEASEWSAGRESLRCLKMSVDATGIHPRSAVTAQGGKYGTIAQMAAKSGNIDVLKWLVEDVGLTKKDIVGRAVRQRAGSGGEEGALGRGGISREEVWTVRLGGDI